MSASSKKKLRKEQKAAALTQKQQKEQNEAKKLKVSSIIFIAVMVVVVITALTVMAIKGVKGSGIIEKNTVAVTVGEHKINSVELNYYFADSINGTYTDWSNMYGDAAASYMAMMGLDVTLPLNEQPYYGEENMTWADYFMESALDSVKANYALYDAAMAEGFTLSEDAQYSLENTIGTAEMYAMFSGYKNLKSYLKANYGPGSDEESYKEYCTVSTIANEYYNAYHDSLEYDDAAIRAYEKDIYNNYTGYTYAYYYLSASDFESEAAAKAAAETLKAATSTEELDAAIAALEINADNKDAASNKAKNALYTGISTIYCDWLADSARQANDIEMFASESTSTDADGNETTTVNGYYVVMFQSKNENNEPMGNVRHLLVEFECTATDEHDHTDFTKEEKDAAKAKADGFLKTWKEGEATEESFIELVKANSDDSSASTGGLFEDIHPNSSYVENFLNWSINPDRVAGDTDVIETEYGYHVMFYVGDDEMTYRDYMITNDMTTEAVDAWYNAIVDAAVVVEGNTSRVNTARVVNPNA